MKKWWREHQIRKQLAWKALWEEVKEKRARDLDKIERRMR